MVALYQNSSWKWVRRQRLVVRGRNNGSHLAEIVLHQSSFLSTQMNRGLFPTCFHYCFLAVLVPMMKMNRVLRHSYESVAYLTWVWCSATLKNLLDVQQILLKINEIWILLNQKASDGKVSDFNANLFQCSNF